MGLWMLLPDKWADDPQRWAGADVPEAARVPRSKGEVALELGRLLTAVRVQPPGRALIRCRTRTKLAAAAAQRSATQG